MSDNAEELWRKTIEERRVTLEEEVAHARIAIEQRQTGRFSGGAVTLIGAAIAVFSAIVTTIVGGYFGLQSDEKNNAAQLALKQEEVLGQLEVKRTEVEGQIRIQELAAESERVRLETEQKFEIVVQATKGLPTEVAAENLSFFVEAGILEDPDGKIARLAEEGRAPDLPFSVDLPTGFTSPEGFDYQLLSENYIRPPGSIRIGSWNISNLHHEEGVELRPGIGTRRTSADFTLLSKYRDLFGSDGSTADVVALQEIGTLRALERLFPPSSFQTIISPRWDNVADEDAANSETYTAIAVRRASGIEFISVENIPELSIRTQDGFATRAGTGVRLQFQNQQFWFVSVHLKSSCSHVPNIHQSERDDCRMLWEQAKVLGAKVARLRDQGIPVIVAGDFNRRLRQFSFNGPFWKMLNGVGPDDSISSPALTAHPELTSRKCPGRKGTSSQPIDWILVDTDLANSVVPGSFWETRYVAADIALARNGLGLSDHCPISVDLRLEEYLI